MGRMPVPPVCSTKFLNRQYFCSDWRQSNPGGFPPQGGPPVGRDVTALQYGGALVIPTSGGGNVDRGPGGGGDICPSPPEHHRPIYHDSSDIGAVSGGGAASGSVDSTYMVVTGMPGILGYKGSGGGGRGGGGYGRGIIGRQYNIMNQRVKYSN